MPVYFLTAMRPVGKIPDRCPDCVAEAETKQLELISRDEEARAVAEARNSAREVLAMVEEAGGNPYEFAAHTLETFRPKPGRQTALDATREWVAAIRSSSDPYTKIRGLYLVGPTGTAKTALAHCALRALIEAGAVPGKEVIFDDALSLIERIQGTYGSDDSTWALLEQRFTAQVWILDDLGAEKPSDDVVRKLTVIFNRRVGRPTMVTSNLTPAQLTDSERNPQFFRLRSRFGPQDYRLVAAEGEDARFDRPGLEKVREL